MKSKKVSIYLLFFCVSILGPSSSEANGQKSTEITVTSSRDTLSDTLKARNPIGNVDSLFVIHFHPTVQCSCCINVGNFAKKGLEKYYAKPYKDGRIIFKEYNIDEDSCTAKRYKIFWSALGFQKFSGEKNEFEEIESVWEFCEEEKKFLVNFKKELGEFMSGTKENKSEGENAKSDVGKPTGEKSE